MQEFRLETHCTGPNRVMGILMYSESLAIVFAVDVLFGLLEAVLEIWKSLRDIKDPGRRYLPATIGALCESIGVLSATDRFTIN